MAIPSSRNGKDVWKASSLRSTFGRQCLTQLPSSPACGFGSAARDQTSKCYVSQEADRAQALSQGGNQSQGAIYKVPDGMGKQFLSTRPSSAQARFGTDKRKTMAVKNSSPGPGAYRVKANIGDTFESRVENSPKMRFGNAHRDAAEKIFLSNEHEKVAIGRDSPGPLAYNVSGGIGKQQSSERETAPGWKLGTDRRFNQTADRRSKEVPGPGQYAVPPAFGPQVSSNKASLPSIGFGTAGARIRRPQTAPASDHKMRAALMALTAQPPAANRRPLEYRLSNLAAPPAWRFGTGRRLDNSIKDSPGPGEYYA